MKASYHFIMSCPDQPGIVAAVSQFVAAHGGFIITADQHGDSISQQFFMRYEIAKDSLSVSKEQFEQDFLPIAKQYDMQWQLYDTSYKKRVLLLASRASHCVEDLLYRWQSQQLPCEIVGVVSNHEDLQERVAWYGLPYEHVPVNADNKEAHFSQVAQHIEGYQPDLIVLARYMQIMPEDICRQYAGRMINIHHGFLPSFAGANPYRQAYEKGVKMMGATAHYVTADLDQGPIIEQDVMRMTHRQSDHALKELGRDVERAVLARAVTYHLEDRVIIEGRKTVVFA